MTRQRAIYIHIPFCRSRCYYCAFLSQCDYSLQDQYIDAVIRHIVSCGNSTDSIASVFIGGGTPSSISNDNIARLLSAVQDNYVLADNAEISIECNPESIDRLLVDTLVSSGVNRVSIGLQSSSDVTLANIGRVHSYQQFVDGVQLLHDSGITNINADIMVGLPEDKKSFVATINAVCNNEYLTHISMYGLELYDSSVLYNNINCGLCPVVVSDDEQTEWYELGYATLYQHGYCRYEVSNFCKADYQCRHNLSYWNCGEYYAFGVGGHSYLDGIRSSNGNDINQYINDYASGIVTVESIDYHGSMEEYVMLQLRLDKGISVAEFRHRYGAELTNIYPNITKLIDKGVLIDNNQHVAVPPKYTYMLSSILVDVFS